MRALASLWICLAYLGLELLQPHLDEIDVLALVCDLDAEAIAQPLKREPDLIGSSAV